MTYAKYDLHNHTCWSYDAFAQVENYFIRATSLGMRCISITEHHVLDSQPEVQEAAARYPDIRVIAAAELSVTTSIGTVDLLCYGFPAELPSGMKDVLNDYHVWQRDFGAGFCRGMQALGYDFSAAHHLELLHSYRPPRTLDVQGATHVKYQVLRSYFIERGFIESEGGYRDVERMAREKGDCPPYPQIERVIPEVHAAGALVAIAHPTRYFLKNDRQRMDQLREECALDGIECAHPAVPPELTPVYREYCVEHGLFSTGGADCHTDEHIESTLGRHIGEEEWLDEFLARLDG